VVIGDGHEVVWDRVMLPPTEETSRNRLRWIITFALILVGFLAYHVLLTPIHILFREVGFPLLRAPILEEAFKVYVAAKLVTLKSHFRRALFVGLIAGAGETIVNVLLNYEEILADVTASFPELSMGVLYASIAFGVSAKLVLATVGHVFFVYAAAVIARGWNFWTFVVAAAIHYAVNHLILTQWPVT